MTQGTNCHRPAPLSVLVACATYLVLWSTSMSAQTDLLDRHMKQADRVARDYAVSGTQPQVMSKTSAVSERIFTGAAANDAFGYSVSSAGDVNGDGYDDIIVGAHGNDAGGANAGRAYIYFGGPTMKTAPDVILTGGAAGDRFGIAVSGAGDVNGDGYADVIVGADYNDAGGNNAGRAYVYVGGPRMDRTPDLILTGAAAGDGFGGSVSKAGDVNGDGYGDLIVGASYNDAGGADAGRAYVFFGGSSLNGVVDLILTGGSAGDWFGLSVSAAGDVNGDGYADIIVGAPRNDVGGTDAGRAYVYHGGSSMDNVADVTLTGLSAGDGFGISVSGAGDVNGDGYSDVIVGAHGSDAGGIDAGRAYVYLGGQAFDPTAAVVLTGAAAGDDFGRSIAGAGDVNGDGYDDVIVGAMFNYAAGFDAGRAYVYFGGARMDNAANVILSGASSGDVLGLSVSGAGDVNGDGYSDILVGAPGSDAGGTDAGKAYVHAYSMTGTMLTDVRLAGEGGVFGASVASAGDVNGDGYDDLIVGAPEYSSYRGRAYIYFGGPNMDDIADVVMTGDSLSRLGDKVAPAGDVNGDGFADVIVSGMGHLDTGGRVRIYFGGSSMDSTADVVMTGDGAGNIFGISAASAGDVNGDGYDDVIVGDSKYNSFAGRAYIYYGGPAMDNVADKIISGEAALSTLGISVACAGDVNGDGFSDVIVGRPGLRSALVFFGGQNMDVVADVTMMGDVGSDFGRMVASAGDVNGDGYADVIVGAETFDSRKGRAHIYFGGMTMDSIADVVLDGESQESYFGASVASSGDINGDGYDDVIVGAYRFDDWRGRTYIFFGGRSMDQVGDVIMTGESSSTFGHSVASAGDVNGDGYPDLVVGAYNASNRSGRAFVYRTWTPPVTPRIASIRDVPFDQGGRVHFAWIRSAYDVKSIGKITDYIVQRSRPPGLAGFAWEPIATITASFEPRYAYTAATWSDSMSGNSAMAYYRVIARTANANELWKSAPVAGYSVDNLAPAPPSYPTVAADPGGLRVSWRANTTDPDVKHYAVYRSTSTSFDPAPELRLSFTADTSYIDGSVAGNSTYYYRITTIDVHGNEGLPTPSVSNSTVAVEEPMGSPLPTEYALGQNYPNPFNPSTVIRYQLPVESKVTVQVFNIVGQPIATLVDAVQPPGYREVRWNAMDLPTGLYFYQLHATGTDGENYSEIRKMMLVK